jgi:hypothetical protein
MLYKVTPAMAEPLPKVVREPGQPRKRRKTSIYDADGHEVLITLMCLKCHKMRPLMQFGLRKMADGAIRNQPWCRTCRSGAGSPKAKKAAEVAADVARTEVAADAPITPSAVEGPSTSSGPTEGSAPVEIAPADPAVI